VRLRRLGWGVVCGAGVWGLWLLAAWWAPFPDERLRRAPENLRVVDAEGGVLRRVLGAGDVDAEWVGLEEAGVWVGPALVAVEDQRFHAHGGVDWVAVLRAAGQNLSRGRVVSGASTISTQVIRMVEPRRRTLWTKGVEAFRATQLEQRYSKAFILEQYLNRAPFGGNRQGVATAARRYFGKEPGHLSAGEAALLMGLPQSPSRLRPDRYPERAAVRQATVLRRMREEGMLAGEVLLGEPGGWVAPPMRAPHFTDWVLRENRGRTGRLETTLDPRVQAVLEAVAAGARERAGFEALNGIGLLALEARTGAVRGWVGGWEYGHPEWGQVDAVTRRRAPGSALKPFAVALGMQQGWLTPETVLEDRPAGRAGYRPQNMDGHWDGEVRVREALVRSLNLPMVGVAERLGAERLVGALRELGFALPGVRAEAAGLGVVIGGGVEVSLLELCRAYRGFAAAEAGMFHEGVGYWMTEMLSGPERDAVLFGHAADSGLPRVAFKTGTSHGHRDAWAVGWNGEWVIGVWLGRMDNRGVAGLTGSTHAAPLLGEVARELFGAGGMPARPASVRVWRGREGIEGVTDPFLPEGTEVWLRFVSPGPGYEFRAVGAGPVRVRCELAGPPGMAVDWFVNGAWAGREPVAAVRVLELGKGDHVIRAIGPGEAAETRVRILD
jgi:penicillin-binding protein 1C